VAANLTEKLEVYQKYIQEYTGNTASMLFFAWPKDTPLNGLRSDYHTEDEKRLYKSFDMTISLKSFIIKALEVSC
jgi:hypothetical protein